jgi:cysteine desulfurase/selenocysteine lyase
MAYLDHAATSWPKSTAVLAAMQRWFADVGVSEARGASSRCRLAAQEVGFARGAIGRLVGLPAERVAFVSGATEGCNLALRALLRPRARVVTTAFEHSSVVRPLRALQAERDLAIEVLPPRAGAVTPAAVAESLARAPADVLVITHASNVTGGVFDAAAICAHARAHGTTTVLDASQTAGLLDLRVGADVVIASGHKALGGPPGIGFVATAMHLRPQKQGGTGQGVAGDTHPTDWPAAFEAGTPNTPAIFGLAAALRELAPARKLQQSLGHLDQFTLGLQSIPGFRLLPVATPHRLPLCSFVHENVDPAEIAAVLAGAGVDVRSGHHCAPWLHEHLGTAHGGTVRVSTGDTTTATDVRQALDVLAALAAG